MVSRKSINTSNSEIFYGGQKLHKYFSHLFNRGMSLLTCLYIGKLCNGEDKPFIVFTLYNFLEGFCFRFIF